MKYGKKQAIQAIIGAVAFIALICFAGTVDYTEQVIYSMSQESYDAIVEKLGDDATQRQIAREYTDNKAFYDQNY